MSDYAGELVRGVHAHAAQIDELLAAYAQGWTLDRMPAVDRNILRIGVFELMWNDSVPDPVAISEAVALAGELSTDRRRHRSSTGCSPGCFSSSQRSRSSAAAPGRRDQAYGPCRALQS